MKLIVGFTKGKVLKLHYLRSSNEFQLYGTVAVKSFWDEHSVCTQKRIVRGYNWELNEFFSELYSSATDDTSYVDDVDLLLLSGA
jgi:hypothetical protein